MSQPDPSKLLTRSKLLTGYFLTRLENFGFFGGTDFQGGVFPGPITISKSGLHELIPNVCGCFFSKSEI